MKEDIFNKISPDEALEILKQIVKTDKKLKKRIVDLAEDLLRGEDMAVEMFEEELEPFIQEMHRLFDLKMHQEAKLYCMGMLKGIYQYEEDSGSEFKDWATDVQSECFGYLLGEWKKRANSIKHKKEMKKFISNECPNWSKWATNQI